MMIDWFLLLFGLLLLSNTAAYQNSKSADAAYSFVTYVIMLVSLLSAVVVASTLFVKVMVVGG